MCVWCKRNNSLKKSQRRVRGYKSHAGLRSEASSNEYRHRDRSGKYPGCTDDCYCAGVCARALYERRAAVLGAAADCKDAAAAAGRSAIGLEYVHGVLPGATAGRLCLCSTDLSKSLTQKSSNRSRDTASRCSAGITLCFIEPCT